MTRPVRLCLQTRIDQKMRTLPIMIGTPNTGHPVLGVLLYEIWLWVQANVCGNYFEYIRELCKKAKRRLDSMGITSYNVGEVADMLNRSTLLEDTTKQRRKLWQKGGKHNGN